MAYTIRVSLPGYNALTDTNPDHYALFVDSSVDYVLIKEKERNSVTVSAYSTQPIYHGLGYYPFVLVFLETTSGTWRKIQGSDEFSGYDTYFYVDTNYLYIRNNMGASKNYKYFIFYDKAL